ncbi:MAG: PAS domain S-box protein [Desulfobaccales bacterium]|nr:PAS domain S-box protein [Desulfobaccales bacterium]
MKIPLIKTFKFKILLLAVMAGFVPLIVIILAAGLFSHHLKRDFSRSLEEIKIREGQRLEEQNKALINSHLRQKALDVSQEIADYLERHPLHSTEKLLRDPKFREIAVQPVGLIGQTFLLTPERKRILLHSQTSLEGEALAKVFPCPRVDEFLDRFGEKKCWSSSLCESESGVNAGNAPRYQVCLAPVSVRPPGGPDLLVGAWADLSRLEQSFAPARVLRTAMNLTGALMDARVLQFQQGIFVFLGGVGLAGLLTGLYLTRRQAREMAALTQAAEAYNAGDLDYRICQPAEDELGELAHTLHRMAASLKENTVSRLEWENTFNIIPDQIMVLDGEQRITRLNRAAAAYMGVSPQEALGRPCYELMHQTPGPPDFCPCGRAIKEGFRSHLEYSFEDKGRTLLVTLDPRRNAAGEIIGSVHVARDITSLKQMQQELAQASHFLKQIIESAPVGVTIVNREGFLTHLNPQFISEYGYTPEEFLNRHYSLIYANEAERLAVLDELRDRGEVLSRRVLLKHQDGRTVPTRISIRKLWGADGELLGSVAMGRNISEEVSLQRQLEQAHKLEAIANLAGGLAHNINNLLMTIMGLTILMLSQIEPGHPFYPDLKDIERQVQAGREITQNLLTFARGTSFKIQPLDLNELVRASADMLARTRRDLVVLVDLPPDLPPVAADPGQIQQVLLNLLINAWQAMPYGGKIVIRGRAVNLTEWQDLAWEVKPGHFVRLAVGDQGVGMDEETMSHLFEPFFTTKGPDQGTGLGLASAYRIIKDHGGAIQVKSKEGKGSTFTIFLPVSQSQPQGLYLEESHLVEGEGTVLVVDDEPTLLRVTARLLEKLGYQVLQAPSGEKALGIFKERGPQIDLVLLDLIMPGLNGLKTLEHLRALDPQVRVLLLSGYEDRLGERLPPEVHFLSKPYSLELLSQKVASALRR